MKNFHGKIEKDVRDSVPDWEPFLEPSAPDDAPNVLYIVWDDMGYGSWDLFGGLIEMPNMKRIADMGVTFSQFHTTAMCAPTRASLLTGRNATANGMSAIGEMANGFPNLSSLIPMENGMISEVLKEQGYNTFAVGKWHLSPGSEVSLGASNRTWPIQRGFSRFYGFLGGLTDQWHPDLYYDNHQIDPPQTPEEGYHLSKDLANHAIQFVADSKATAPKKPWMMYLCPGACHAPHHIFSDWADKYKGKFDDGYEQYRRDTLKRQKDLGLIPDSVELPPINPFADKKSVDGKPWNPSDIVLPWDSLNEDQKRFFIRQAEVYAGFASYTDYQIGRFLDYLEKTGQLDNTIIVALSDNGASAEGGPTGTVNENDFYNGVKEDMSHNIAHLKELGSPATHPNYSAGWAMAFNTPFKMYKMNASWEGGCADPMVFAWKNGIKNQGVISDAYMHTIDITPTVYDLLNLIPPAEIRGAKQTELHGVSMKTVLEDVSQTTPKDIQFYQMLGTRGIWKEGWHASSVHPPSPGGWGHYDQDEWNLFDLTADRNQMNDLSQSHPEKLEEMKNLWDQEAKQYQGYPLCDFSVGELIHINRPSVAGKLKELTFYPGTSEVPETIIVLDGQSFYVDANFTIEDTNANGVIFSVGGRFGGYTMFLVDGILKFVYNWLGRVEQMLVSPAPLSGRTHVHFEFNKTGMDENIPTGTGTLTINGKVADTINMKIQPGHFSIAGQGFNVGKNRGQSVTKEYIAPNPIQGADIDSVTIGFAEDGTPRPEKEGEAAFRRD